MEQIEIETLINNIDARTTRIEERMTGIEERATSIEQILPTLATKQDLKVFATKDDLKAFATKDDLKAFATKTDLEAFETKVSKVFATKDDVREEGERTRRHFDAFADQMKADIVLIAEGHAATRTYVDGRLEESRAQLKSLDARIMKLETRSVEGNKKSKRRSTRP